MHIALVDCPLRVVVNVQQSKIGFSYPRIFVEEHLKEKYVNYDLTVGAAFKMKESDFEDWWSDAEPLSLHDMCIKVGLEEMPVRDFLKGLRPEVPWKNES